MLACINMLNSFVANEAQSKVFFKRYLRLAYSRIERGQTGQPDPEFVAFLKAHPNLEPVVQDAFMGGLLAMTFLNNHWGLKYRAMLADLYGRERRPIAVLHAFKESGAQAALPAAA
jgi:hypothetical protein